MGFLCWPCWRGFSCFDQLQSQNVVISNHPFFSDMKNYYILDSFYAKIILINGFQVILSICTSREIEFSLLCGSDLILFSSFGHISMTRNIITNWLCLGYILDIIFHFHPSPRFCWYGMSSDILYYIFSHLPTGIFYLDLLLKLFKLYINWRTFYPTLPINLKDTSKVNGSFFIKEIKKTFPSFQVFQDYLLGNGDNRARASLGGNINPRIYLN